MELIQVSPAIIALIPVVIGLTALAKLYIDSKWAPLTALALGVAGAFLFPAVTVPVTILSGIIVGLSASGLYSGAKALSS